MLKGKMPRRRWESGLLLDGHHGLIDCFMFDVFAEFWPKMPFDWGEDSPCGLLNLSHFSATPLLQGLTQRALDLAPGIDRGDPNAYISNDFNGNRHVDGGTYGRSNEGR
jgi:hypothetical protein